MKRVAALLLVAGLAWGGPAAAQSSDGGKPAHAGREAGLTGANRQSEEFGQWLLSANTAVMPALESVRSLQGEWAQTVSNANPRAASARFLGFIDQTRGSIAESRRALDALPTPAFDALDLPADLQTPTIKRQMAETLDQMDAMVAGFPPLLDAMLTNDEAAGRAAAVNLFRSAAVLYDNQRLFARAALATSEPDTSDYHAARFEVLFFEAGGRMIDTASRLIDGRSDTALASDLLRFAEEIDRIAEEATVTARTAKQQAENDAAGAGGQAVPLIERARRIEALSIENIGIWRRYSAALRTGGTQLQTGQLTFGRLQSVIQIITPTRIALDDVALRQAEILAGVR